MFKLAAGSAIVAALLGATGYLQNQTLSMFQDTPSTLSAQDLAADNPGDNRHITLTDFVIPDDHVIELNDWNQPRRAWIKAVPVGSEAHQALQEAEHLKDPAPKVATNIIIEVNSVWSRDQLDRIVELESITGFITNDYRDLDPETRKLIDDGFNKVDAENTWVISFGEKAPNATIARAKLGGGALFALLALIFAFSGLKKMVFGSKADEYEGILGAPIPTAGAPMSYLPPMKTQIDAPLVPESSAPGEDTAEDVVEAA